MTICSVNEAGTKLVCTGKPWITEGTLFSHDNPDEGFFLIFSKFLFGFYLPESTITH